VSSAPTAEAGDVALLRLVSQGLVGGGGDAVHAVQRLLAVQAQDLPGALVSVALRSRSRAREDVLAALDDGRLVRSWPMRGTLHLVAADDLSWLLRTTAPRAVATSVARRDELGLTEAVVERARDVAREALADGARLRRGDLTQAWQLAGIDTGGQRGYHLLAHLAMTGTLCQGPMAGDEQLFVLASTWLPAGRDLAGDEALHELALRYFRGHGPATTADLARWAGITMTAARTGAALARSRLATLDVDGVEHLLDPDVPDVLAACRDEARRLRLLPGFDEYLLGYGDRSAVLAAEHAPRIVPGGNGVFRPTVVLDGRVVGTWRRVPGRRGAPESVDLEPFDELSAEAVGAARAAHLALP
jgi:hypothetical protein